MISIEDMKTPVVDCHRHLGGCIPVWFVWETIQNLNLAYLAETLEDVRKQMTFAESEPRDFHRFLDKFKILDEIPWTEDLIDKSIQAVCKDLAFEQLDHAWIDFSINKYMKIGWNKAQAVEFVYDSFQRHYPYKISLVLGIKYEAMLASQRQYAKLLDHEVSKRLIGIDFVGDENEIDHVFHGQMITEWAKADKMVRAHVGEYGSVQNIKMAIARGATNIAHGLEIINDVDLMHLAKDMGICFDMGLTTNFLTNVVEHIHPLKQMLDFGLKMTIGTDDPVVADTTMEDEYAMAMRLGATIKQIKLMKQTAISQAGFWSL